MSRRVLLYIKLIIWVSTVLPPSLWEAFHMMSISQKSSRSSILQQTIKALCTKGREKAGFSPSFSAAKKKHCTDRKVHFQAVTDTSTLVLPRTASSLVSPVYQCQRPRHKHLPHQSQTTLSSSLHCIMELCHSSSGLCKKEHKLTFIFYHHLWN